MIAILAAGILATWDTSSLLRTPHPSDATGLIAANAHSDTGPEPSTPSKSTPFHYIEIIDGCGPYYGGDPCVNLRSERSLDAAVVARLRTGVVLRVEATTTEENGHEWYSIIFDGALRYPERVAGKWYVAVDPESVQPFDDVGDKDLTGPAVASTKRIVVDLTDERLYAYDGDVLFMDEPISTGLEFTPTPRGTFTVFRKTPSRYMQGPIPGVSNQYYDLPGVPWNLYFTYGGAVIHGAYWHDHFGEPWSHGCVNLPPQKAKALYEWADTGTTVVVRD